MLPIGPLMAEHRLIERMVRLMKAEMGRMGESNSFDAGFLDTSIDFLRTYADRCHHGKEEDILFRELSKKKLTPELGAAMQQLIEDHVHARKTVRNLELSKEDYVKGNTKSIGEITRLMGDLVELYPRHIGTEDRAFFYPCMDYFTNQEREAMLQEFREFDRNLIIHEAYRGVVEKLEKSGYGKMAKWRCKVCGYIYDPGAGDPEGGVRPGTSFEDIHDDWRCPVCNAPKTEFEKVE